MIFNSLVFVVFFAIVLILHSMPFSWRVKKINLLIASYIFYAAWNPPFVILLWLSTVVDWFAARGLAAAENPWKRRAWMMVSIVVSLGLLCYFKYGHFLLDNFAHMVSMAGFKYSPPKSSIILPIGISFYTFATMSYTLDIYLRRSAPARNFLDYALFVTFFPHLVAGPIMRPTELVPQFEVPHQATASQMRFGLALMTLGLFEKSVLADGFLGPVVDLVYNGRSAPGFIDAWMGTLAFSGQIFCDFAGYSITAIGAALCLGFALSDNFRFPYAAIGFTDFWRRWHITLSAWLRDYVYIPMGGNKRGNARTYFSLMATMLIGGLWHGASWTFVVWGGLHGLYLSVERMLRKPFRGYHPGPIAGAALGLLTFLFVNIAWVFFRAKTFPQAIVILRGMFGRNHHAEPILAAIYLITTTLIIGGLLLAHSLMRNKTLEMAIARLHPATLTALWTIMAFAVVIQHGESNGFIYFQF
ncbi:MBOAT family O-acyltransferase [Tunturiibacter gelidoferens]|jgi:alginate O-acetyltransferase complex protein AlgI|uniref:Alginate O-acetyltransferase complex protein AlgI n=1 Tax=Tunturiibacter gelidiferens TaxID=3069689 RepID=A0A9X0U2F2_9BACT|nr:MBOAT family protein [Edaphobacter lichenicola]MBB5327324.1 alginate O-acetyltransferase complex protein AlgI [Edaphobacter lichenicola]